MMNRQENVRPRLHMGCGESLRSQLLLGMPRPLVRDENKRCKHPETASMARSRTRG